jgi:hypothetical protein
MTIHLLAITHGDLTSYKVQVRVFGGATGGDLGKDNENTVTTQKWVNLLSLMLDSFKNNGHCVTIDSAYIGDIMAMVGHNVWRINMVGTAQANRTGANIDCTKSMKKGMYNSVCWQHVWRSLCFAVWSDNALVRTLSNFHGPEILEAGMGVLRKKRNGKGKRERTKLEVPCPVQTKDYCVTFHLIDKGNGAEVNYNLGGKSCLHNWFQKLNFWFFNMALNNAYKMYTALVKEHTPERRFLEMGNAVRELTHDLCQGGPAMWKLRAEHPSLTQDMGKLFGWITGRKVRSESLMMPPVQAPPDNYAMLKNQQRRSPWRIHQSKAIMKQGKCCWDNYPGKKVTMVKRPRSSNTHMHCKECSAYLGKDISLCNGFVNGAPVNCQWHYHIYPQLR